MIIHLDRPGTNIDNIYHVVQILIEQSLVTEKNAFSILGLQPRDKDAILQKLSILLIFYFHEVLEQPKTNVHTNFRFKGFLGFVLEYA